LAARIASPTERERQVMTLVASGLLTVKIHRASMMRKIGAASLADVVRIADAAGIRPGA
jgi:FixJ family two-component response regulator